MLTRILIVLGVWAFVGWSAARLAAQDLIRFENDTHDFGEVEESDEKIRHTFKFRNTANEPVKLVFVKPSCGCTTSEYTTELIPPGGEGFILAEYETKARPGAFDKDINVRVTPASNLDDAGTERDRAVTQTLKLRIKGQVNGNFDALSPYAFALGDLKATSDNLTFGRITSKETSTVVVSVQNPTNQLIQLLGLEPNPYVTLTFDNPVLQPGAQANLTFVFHGEKVKDYGEISGGLRVKTSLGTPKDSIYFTALVVEDFSHLTEAQRAAAPKLEINDRRIVLGNVPSGTRIERVLTITNKGKQPLIIRKALVANSLLTVTLPKAPIAPGKSAEVKVVLNTQDVQGGFFDSINLLTNDPENALLRISVTAAIGN
jgi:hypothetical protein